MHEDLMVLKKMAQSRNVKNPDKTQGELQELAGEKTGEVSWEYRGCGCTAKEFGSKL